MKTFKLLDFAPKRRGGGLFLIGLLLLVAAAADQFFLDMFGSFRIFVWGAGGLLVLLAAFMFLLSSAAPPASVDIEEDGLIVKYGNYELPITYEDIQTIVGGRVAQHHPLKSLSGRERQLIQPYINQTQVFLELHEAGEEFQEAKEHMPSFMFGTKQLGILLLVEGDWIPLERAIDAARVEWMRQLRILHEKKNAPKDPWDDDDEDEFEDEEEDWRA